MEAQDEKKNGFRRQLEEFRDTLHKKIIILECISARAMSYGHWYCDDDRPAVEAMADIGLIIDEDLVGELTQLKNEIDSLSLNL
jgi:hypothetical protein